MDESPEEDKGVPLFTNSSHFMQAEVHYLVHNSPILGQILNHFRPSLYASHLMLYNACSFLCLGLSTFP